MPLKSCDRNAVKSKNFSLLWPVLFVIIILQCFKHWLSLLCLCQERLHLREVRWAYLNYIHTVFCCFLSWQKWMLWYSLTQVLTEVILLTMSGHQLGTLRMGREHFLQKCYNSQDYRNSCKFLFLRISFVTKTFVQLYKSSKEKSAPTKSWPSLAQWRVVCIIIWS